MDKNFLVCVRCMTYNHASYIEDTMNGFCMQETNFPFVCTIIDDASTDGEQEVIKKYLRKHFDLENRSIVFTEENDKYVMTFAQHIRNKNCYFAVYFLKYNHYSIKKTKQTYIKKWIDQVEYVALCEGDDYWIASEKLQKQVDFLSNKPNYSMCFHNAGIKREEEVVGTCMDKKVEDRDYNGNELFFYWIVPTCSIVYRKNVTNVVTKGNDRILYGDIINILKCATVGFIRGFSQEMSIYRLHSNGVSHNEKSLKMSVYRKVPHYKFILDNFGSIVEKKNVYYRISYAYLDIFKAEKALTLKAWGGLFLSLLYNPKVIFVRIINKFLRIFKFSCMRKS